MDKKNQMKFNKVQIVFSFLQKTYSISFHDFSYSIFLRLIPYNCRSLLIFIGVY